MLQENEVPAVASSDHDKKKRHRLGLIRQWIATGIIGLTHFISGTCLGWASPALYVMRATGDPVNLTSTEVAAVASLIYIGNLVVPIPCALLTDLKGRKFTLLISAILPFTSWILVFFAKNSYMLMASRLLAGMWSGAVQTVVPLYIAEIAEPKQRGAMSSMSTFAVNAGLLLSFSIGPLILYKEVTVSFGLLPVIFFLGLYFLPESPYWFVYVGFEAEAVKSLAWYRGSENVNDVQEEFKSISNAVRADLLKSKNIRTLLTVKHYRKALFIVEFLSFFKRMTGVGALVAYGAITLPDKHLGFLTPNSCLIVIEIARTITVLPVLFFLAVRFGRVPLLLTSCAGCCLAMMTASVWFYLYNGNKDISAQWIPFVVYLVFGCFFNVGLAPMVTTLQGEMFPSHLKTVASGITAVVLAISSAIINFCFIPIAINLGTYVNYVIYTLICLLCFIFVWTYVVETKGKTLLEVQELLEGSTTSSRSKKPISPSN